MGLITFDKENIQIDKYFKTLFDTNELEKMHYKYTSDNSREIFNAENDNTTFFHKHYFENIKSFQSIYIKLIETIFFKRYSNESFIVYQQYPALRVSIPNNVSVGEMHCDNDYNHPEEEMNYWLPITKVNENNTVIYESKENKGDFAPLLINYGEIAEVYFNKCRHYSKINNTDDLRLSLDFRIIPGSKWDKLQFNKEKTKFAKVKFDDYYIKYQPSFSDYFNNSYSKNKLICCKLFHYFSIYDELFKSRQLNSINMLEIGIKMGGSIELHNTYFKNLNKYIGIDINDDCKKFEKLFNNVSIYIGDQKNIEFLNFLNINNLDIIIDDGGHQFEQQINSFNVLFNKLNDNGIYLIEDTHSSYDNYSNIYPKDNVYNGKRFGDHTTIEYFKRLSDEVTAWAYNKTHGTAPLYNPKSNSWVEFMNTYNLEGDNFINILRDTIHSITFYDSIIVIKKKQKTMPFILFNNNNNYYTFHDKKL